MTPRGEREGPGGEKNEMGRNHHVKNKRGGLEGGGLPSRPKGNSRKRCPTVSRNAYRPHMLKVPEKDYSTKYANFLEHGPAKKGERSIFLHSNTMNCFLRARV